MALHADTIRIFDNHAVFVITITFLDETFMFGISERILSTTGRKM